MLSGLENFNFDVLYILSQIFALAGMIFSLVAVQQRKKIQLLNYDVVGSACAMLHYVCLGAWSGVASKAISLIRNIIAGYGDAHQKKFSKKWLVLFAIIFVSFYIIGGIIAYESMFSLLPAIGAAIYTAVLYLGKVKAVRYASGLASIMWLIYNIHVFSIVGIISESVFIVNDVVAIWRYRKKRGKNQKKSRQKRKK